MVRLVVCFVMIVACSADNVPRDGGFDERALDGAASADSAREAGGEPRGCAAPPSADFDPIAGYVAPQLAPTAMVTTTADSGAGSLREAVGKGGVVGFAAELAGKTLTVASTIEITKSVTITGAGAKGVTLSGAQKSGIFRFNGDAPTKLGFFALTLADGRTMGSGAAISVNGGAVEVEIGGVRFERNVAGEGGAIRVGYKSPKVSVHDSTFVENDGSITNNGFSGGAISVSGGNLLVQRCRFASNVGSTTGAVYGIHANPVIENRSSSRTARPETRAAARSLRTAGGPATTTTRSRRRARSRFAARSSSRTAARATTAARASSTRTRPTP